MSFDNSNESYLCIITCRWISSHSYASSFRRGQRKALALREWGRRLIQSGSLGYAIPPEEDLNFVHLPLRRSYALVDCDSACIGLACEYV